MRLHQCVNTDVAWSDHIKAGQKIFCIYEDSTVVYIVYTLHIYMLADQLIDDLTIYTIINEQG